MLAQQIFAQTGLVILAIDLDGRLVDLNPAAARLFGRPADLLIGTPFLDALDSFSRDKGRLMLALTQSEGSVSDWELNHHQPQGPPLLLVYTTTLLRDEQGSPYAVAAIGQELNRTLDLAAQLARTNQQLEEALNELEQAHKELKTTQARLVQSEKMRALGQLVAGVAHEINTPLAYLSNNLAFLAERLPMLQRLFAAYAALKSGADAEQRAAIAAVEAEVRQEHLWEDLRNLVAENREGVLRIDGIVRSLRNFARLDEADLKSADLNSGLASTARIVRSLFHARIKVVEQYAPLPPVLCYPGELNQVFLNLMMNAAQAIEGTGWIEISSSYANGEVVITVRDNGHGMDEQVLARIGEPFFTTRPLGIGSGLGLAVSFSIVAHHGGQIMFSSVPGQGTTATVCLPVTA